MAKSESSLFFVVALSAEAAPLVAHYGLRRDHAAKMFPVFRRDEDGVALAISGLGKIASAAATAFLQRHVGGVQPAGWLNVGIAGHGKAQTGDIYLAHKIRDQASGRSFFPPLVFAPPIPTGEIITVDQVELDYLEKACYEMEASGFYEIACRVSTAECVHCVKVITDGPNAASIEKLDRTTVETVIKSRLPEIERIAQQISDLATEVQGLDADPPHYQACLDRWRFTVSQAHQLRQILRRWQAAWPDVWPEEELRDLRRGKDVLRALEQLQHNQPISLAKMQDDGQV